MSKKHEALMLKVMDQYSGTPEEFGHLLHDATMMIIHWSADVRADKDRKAHARATICRLDGGFELLKMEDKFLARA